MGEPPGLPLEPMPGDVVRADDAATTRLTAHPDYLLVRELGRGGMGIVYEARDTRSDRPVAFKVLLHGEHAGPEALERFRTEGEALARLRHANVVRVYETGTYGGLPFLALEYCAGGNLAARLRPGPLPPTQAAEVAEAVARGLAACHAAGVVHRDLKPANVLFAEEDGRRQMADGSGKTEDNPPIADGEGKAGDVTSLPLPSAICLLPSTPKITDFGLAKLFDRDTRTRTGAVLGTPAYMAPEQAGRNPDAVGPAADVWALGAILYEMLTGRPPFAGATDLETLERIRRDEPVPPRALSSGVPAGLEAVALRCLEKSPAARYPDVVALADDLARWRRGEPVHATRLPLGRRVARIWSRHRGRAAAVAVVLAATGVYLGLADAGVTVPGGEVLRALADRMEVSLLRRVPPAGELARRASALRQRLGRQLAVALDADDGLAPMSLGDPGAGPPDAWTQGQTVTALCATPEMTGGELVRAAVSLPRLFEPGGRVPAFAPGDGWPLDGSHAEPAAEPALWVAAGMAAALSRPGLVPEADRGAWLDRLGHVQAALENYRSTGPDGRPTGAWNMFARQLQPGLASPYTTALALSTLLELRRAGLPWAGSPADRDRLLTATGAWLIDQYDGRGWRCPSTQPDEYSDGLTLIVFALLLRAEAEAGLNLPDEVVQQIPRHLADCATRELRYPTSMGHFDRTFADAHGQTRRVERTVRFLWHPWAIRVASRWLRRAERLGRPHEEAVQARRALGHLVLTLGPPAADDAVAGYTYVAAELLLALAALEPVAP